MGLFDLFKKKGKDSSPDLANQMLEMKKRTEPVKLKNTEKKETSHIAEKQTPAKLKTNVELKPAIDQPTLPQLQTQSTEKKNLDSVPNVKKLVIPANDETNSQLVQPTDTATTKNHPKQLTQVSLSQTQPTSDEKPSLTPPNAANTSLGDSINIPLSLVVNHIHGQFLVSDAINLISPTETLRFGKEEILPILAQGSFSVVGGALLERIPEKLTARNAKDVKDIFNIPLDDILPLIPPEWFILQGQDESLTESIQGMNNPFADALKEEKELPPLNTLDTNVVNPSRPEQKESEETEEVAVNIEEEGDEPLETIVQEAPSRKKSSLFTQSQSIDDPIDTAIQLTPPPSMGKSQNIFENDIDILTQTSSDNFLTVPAQRLVHIVRNPHSTLSLPKDKAIACLKEGQLKFSRKELCKFAGVNDNSILSNDETVDLGLGTIIDLIPPEWLTIEDQDTKHTDTLDQMKNIFGDGFGEEKEKPEKEEAFQEESKPKTTNTPTGQRDSLITGGFFGNSSDLFEDDEEEEISIDIEEEVEQDVNVKIEEPDTEHLLDEEDVEEEEISIDIEEEVEQEVDVKIEENIKTTQAENSTETSYVTEKQAIATTYQKPARPSLGGNIPKAKEFSTRPSTAPNGIDINRSNLSDLCKLHSAGEKLAQTIISYRQENGDFKRVNDLLNVPGVGSSVYRSLTGLKPSADLEAAERRLNRLVDLDIEKDYPLGKLVQAAQEKFNFKSLILSEKDGFEICSTGDTTLLESNSELLAAATPQLFKKTKHFLKQANLPNPEVFTFYLEENPVTFGIAGEVFLTMVHDNNYPDARHMKICRQLINELAWYCSFRAVV